MHDNWSRMLQDDEPPKSSWRPRKSKKPWGQLSVQKLTKVTQSLKKVHREGKLVLPSLVASMMYQHSRCASREKTWVQSTKKLDENWDAISLVFLSAVLWERISAASGAYCTILSLFMLLNVLNCSLLLFKVKILKFDPSAFLLFESLRSPRIEHLRSITTSHEKWKKIQYCAENFVLLLVSFFLLHRTYVSDIVIAGLWKFYFVSSNNTKWEYEWTSTRRPVTNPVTGRRTSTGRPVTAWIAMRKGVTEKRTHTHFLKDWICEMQEGQNFLDSMQETHRWIKNSRA